jgi:hypothetical protein
MDRRLWMDFPTCLCACTPIRAGIIYLASRGEILCMELNNPCMRNGDSIEEKKLKDIEKRIEQKHE